MNHSLFARTVVTTGMFYLLIYLPAVEHFTTALRRAGVRTFDQRRHVSIANVGVHHDGPMASILCWRKLWLMEDWRAVWLGVGIRVSHRKVKFKSPRDVGERKPRMCTCS